MIPGINHNIPLQDYLAHPALGKSLLGEIVHSPARLQWRKENPRNVSPEMLFGSAVDTLIFDGQEAFDRRFIERPPGINLATKAGRAWKAEVAAGRAIVPGDVLGCADSLLQYPELPGDGYASQVSLLWEDPETGIMCKGRPDWVAATDRIVADLKATKNASVDAFADHCFRMRWHWLAWYCMGLEVITGEPHDRLDFVAAEPDPPYKVERHTLGMAELEQGRNESRAALDQYAACVADNWWPSSTGKIETIRFKPWALR
jgi:hypothetical protein